MKKVQESTKSAKFKIAWDLINLYFFIIIFCIIFWFIILVRPESWDLVDTQTTVTENDSCGGTLNLGMTSFQTLYIHNELLSGYHIAFVVVFLCMPELSSLAFVETKEGLFWEAR